jgi:dihydrolipoamide dehydrogenase
MSKKIIVIGGGPAGIEAARAAAKVGARVTIVSNAPLGGRAGWHSLLPSKVWLTTADSLALFSEADTLGISISDKPRPAPKRILERIHQVKASWNSRLKDELLALGIEIVIGTAAFTTNDSIQVTDKEGKVTAQLHADAFIVAAGSVPIFPPVMRPNGKSIIAPRFASALDELPPSMVVVGGGATGSEFAYLFNRLGVDVTWIVDQFGVLPDFDPEAGQFLAQTLEKQGVNLIEGQMASQIDQTEKGIAVVLADGSRYPAAMAFLAIGRIPDLDQLNLAAAGLAMEKGTAVVDGYGRTTQPHIYLVGDATGAPMIANKATAQAWIAGQHAGGGSPAAFQPETVIAAIYTEPQVAQVGSLAGSIVKLPYAASLKAHLLPEAVGFVKLAYDGENGRILGGAAAGPHAADLLAPVAVAVQAEMNIHQFGTLYGAHPTFSELAFAAARQV